jgi:uncharacterized protein
MEGVNLTTVFLTGLLAGGLSCMAVQGGLLATTIAQNEEEALATKEKSKPMFPVLYFLIAKLAAYTILGFLLGLVGSFFAISITAKAIMLTAVSIFMIGTALNMLNIHPIFEHFVIRPPKFLSGLITKQSKNTQFLSPAILGALTIFIPCGITQSMIALAITSANPTWGALIMFTFVLGTSPVFFTIGYFVAKLGERFKKKFLTIVAFFIIFLAVFNLNNALALSGNPVSVEDITNGVKCTILSSTCDNTNNVSQPTVEKQTIEITSSGYSPSEFSIKKGQKATVTLRNQGTQGCIQAFTIPAFNIQEVVPAGTTKIITIEPRETGDIPFMCSMGMYRGVIHVL